MKQSGLAEILPKGNGSKRDHSAKLPASPPKATNRDCLCSLIVAFTEYVNLFNIQLSQEIMFKQFLSTAEFSANLFLFLIVIYQGIYFSLHESLYYSKSP